MKCKPRWPRLARSSTMNAPNAVESNVDEAHVSAKFEVRSITFGGKYIRRGSVHVTYMSTHWGWVSRQIDTRLEMAGLQESSLLPEPQCSSSRTGLIEKTIYCRVPAD